jgi:hypothetical protein
VQGAPNDGLERQTSLSGSATFPVTATDRSLSVSLTHDLRYYDPLFDLPKPTVPDGPKPFALEAGLSSAFGTSFSYSNVRSFANAVSPEEGFSVSLNLRLGRPRFVVEPSGSYRVSADLSLGGGVLGQINLGAARAQLVATGSQIQLNNFDADILGGRASGDAVVSTARGGSSRVAAEFSPAVFASSLAAEDMVLTDLILRNGLDIGIFSLDTGRLHAETLGLLARIEERYGYRVAVFRPHADAVDAYVAQHGANAFYDSIEMRKQCCRIRKVEFTEEEAKQKQ